MKSVVCSGDACVDNRAEFGSVERAVRLPSKPSEVFNSVTRRRSKQEDCYFVVTRGLLVFGVFFVGHRQECGCVSGLLKKAGLC